MLITAHLIIAIITGLIVLYSDEQAFEWFRGKTDTMIPTRVLLLHRVVTVGLILLMLTGGLMYAQAAPAYLSVPTFILKMTMIFALIVNSYFIERLSEVALTRSFSSLSHPECFPLFVSGAISMACWVTVFICGLLIA